MKFKQKSLRKIPDSLTHLGKNFLIGINSSKIDKIRLEEISDKLDWSHSESFFT